MFQANRTPRLPNAHIYPYWRWLCWWGAALHYKFIVTGIENIPAPGGKTRGRDYYPDKSYNPFTDIPADTHAFVLAPNHKSLADIVAVGYLKRPFVLVGKPFFAMIPGLKGFFELNGLLPVFRPGKDNKGSKLFVTWRRHVSLRGEEMIPLAVRAAKLGIPVEIYPEGERDKGDKESKGRFGAIQIAMEAGVPLLPAGIYYGPTRGLARRLLPRPRASAVRGMVGQQPHSAVALEAAGPARCGVAGAGGGRSRGRRGRAVSPRQQGRF